MKEINENNALDILHGSPVFQGVPRKALEPMVSALDTEHWRQRRAVMTPEQTVNRFYVLLKGRVKITRQSLKTGREVTLFLLGPGDGFNVVSLLDGRKQQVSAQTVDNVVALSGPTQLWRGWLETCPELRRALRGYVDGQLRYLADLAGDLAVHDTMTRLAHLILRYFDGDGRSTLVRENLIRDLSHEELAHMIGTVRVVVNRLLAELKREGIVDTEGGELRVLDLQRLLHKAEHHVGDVRSISPSG